ncbi:MAG TPA: tyrosinase family protein [Thermoanaerobaculia bacterium]|jgi:tyrosinase
MTVDGRSTGTTTRYERVIEILDQAAGASTADYGRRGPFWRVPLPELLDLQVHGVRMIAPAGSAEACPCCEPESRAAKSGLILGLRGEAPFDGSRFPPLPWGGGRVSQEDISFISDWIDDGCPAEDRQTTIAAKGEVSTELEEIGGGNFEPDLCNFEVYEGTPNEYRYEHGELKQRSNLDCMTETQVDRLRDAFRELYKLNKWPEDRRSFNNQALVHQNHCQHGWERFLPWHRVYLYEFEQTLQDFARDVTLPYWDWTMLQYVPSKPQDGQVIPTAFKAFLTRASLIYLENATPNIPKPQCDILLAEMIEPGYRYTRLTEFFAAVGKMIGPQYTAGDYRKRFIDALLAANSLWYPLRYPAQYQKDKKPVTVEQKFHYHYPTGEDMEQIRSLRTFRDFGGGSLYNDSFGFLDQNPHNTMHIWTGGQNPEYVDPTLPPGDVSRTRNRGVEVRGRRFHTREDMYQQPMFGDMLSNLTASYDPVFWPIHANIDRTWSEWQQMNPHSLPADLDAVLTPWSYTIRDTLDWTRFGYEYVKCSYIVPVGLSTPVGRFVSKPIDLPKPARGTFRQAEVRLHRVPQLPRSCFIRVFLNLPDANANTSIEDPHYGGYLAIFGHGPCIGGPGHCEVPPKNSRPYDLRPRSHNTPRNHRINVTKAARRLLEEGASSLQITLVVIGADYNEDNELLRLDGVSLDLLD